MGNLMGLVGMMVAIIVVFVYQVEYNTDDDIPERDDDNGSPIWLIPLGCAVGGAFGVFLAKYVKMTSMPELVGLFNAFGGLAAALESIALYIFKFADSGLSPSQSRLQMAFLLLSIVIGMVTFVGSIIACLKLNGQIGNPKIPGVRILSFLVLVSVLVLMVLCGLSSYSGPDEDEVNLNPVLSNNNNGLIYVILLTFISSLWGVFFVVPIGGADMPVVISILNSFSGMSGATAGFMLSNNLLIITGSLVASSGLILSYIMCRAMNRSITNVLAGGFGEAAASAAPAAASAGAAPSSAQHTPIETPEVGELLLAAKNILIVPGYGMAVSRAQQAVAELTSNLIERGKTVRFGIHPVAGRLPGHMNVLLAEARVPYTIVNEMDEVNPSIDSVDVVMVIGANDTVNPAAETDPTSSIAGMPVIRVWKAKKVIVMKRSMAQGYAAIENPLFFHDNTVMYFGDAKKNLDQLLDKIRKAPMEVAGPSKKKEEKKKEAVIKESDYPTASKIIGVIKETADKERRVAMTPSMVPKFRMLGFGLLIEDGAGNGAGYTNDQYIAMGCSIVSQEEMLSRADIVFKFDAPTNQEIQKLRQGQVLISYAQASFKPDLLKSVAAQGATWLAMDSVPRITAAQKLDSLSSMGKIAGYRTVIEAAHAFELFFAPEITAAGKYPPATVMIIGAGVAGLAAIGVANSLGAEVRCFDTRLVTKEQVESLGGIFLELTFKEDGTGEGGYAKTMSKEFYDAEMALFAEQAKEVDIIITTAQIPGRPAPILLKKEHIDAMKPGSVVVDLAASTGGNCELTKAGISYKYDNKVTIIGYTDFTSRMAAQASQMYANNLMHLMTHMGSAAKFNVKTDDEVVRPMMVAHQGQVTFPPPKIADPTPVAAASASSSSSSAPSAKAGAKPEIVQGQADLTDTELSVIAGVVLLSVVLIAIFFPATFPDQLMVFMLSCVIGYNSIWGVAPALFTPLMSLSNAISGVVILGGMVQLVGPISSGTLLLSFFAIAFGATNVFGGFAVTQRMLDMFVIKPSSREDDKDKDKSARSQKSGGSDSMTVPLLKSIN